MNEAPRPDEPVLREATDEDLPFLLQMARAFYDEDGFQTTDALLRQNFEVLLADANARVMLACRGQDVVAFALTTTGFTLESGVMAELQDLYVVPDQRRRGIASSLISDALSWAESNGAAYLEVVVAPNDKDVSHLFSYYEARGFRDEGRQILARHL